MPAKRPTSPAQIGRGHRCNRRSDRPRRCPVASHPDHRRAAQLRPYPMAHRRHPDTHRRTAQRCHRRTQLATSGPAAWTRLLRSLQTLQHSCPPPKKHWAVIARCRIFTCLCRRLWAGNTLAKVKSVRRPMRSLSSNSWLRAPSTHRRFRR